MTFNPEPYDSATGAWNWLIAILVILIAVLIVSVLQTFLVSLFSRANRRRSFFAWIGHAIIETVMRIGMRIAQGIQDVAGISIRRICALAALTIKESWRRKALGVFVVFAILFMFASWFLSDSTVRADLQFKNYISFVMRSISWLTLPVILLLSCWSLPDDIKARSLHTVVTKPARRLEIVLGRMLGFVSVTTVILLIMGSVGFVWLVRQVPAMVGTAKEQIDGHTVVVAEREDGIEVQFEGDETSLPEGVTKPEYFAKSLAELRGESAAAADLVERVREQAILNLLACRVPIYGTDFKFLTPEGVEGEGTNVGDMWEHRKYIEGATKARGIWIVPIGTEPQESVTLESRFEAFRTHKGRIGQEVLGRFSLVNPADNRRVSLPSFEVNEFTQNVTHINRTLSHYDEAADKNVEVDLFKDLVDKNGNIIVEIECMDSGQFLGMAKSDLFIRLPDQPFQASYAKAIFGVWLMGVLVVVLGVTISCLVKGPVGTLFMSAFGLVGAYGHELMTGLVTGSQRGGGALEASYRLATHMNDIGPLPDLWFVPLLKGGDQVLKQVLTVAVQIVPDFGVFRMSEFIANGFDVPWSSCLLPCATVTIAYLLPCILIGYYSLSLRELESK